MLAALPRWTDYRSPAERKSRDGDCGVLRQLLGNADSHADRHGPDCRPALGSDSSLAGIARTAAVGQTQQPSQLTLEHGRPLAEPSVGDLLFAATARAVI
jgi:hypothetical protein